MRVLAIDTALGACSAAVLDTEHGRVAHESVPMNRGHAEALMPLIARVMRQADMPFTALDRVVTTVGPGSFTGLRVGISAARGIALAAGKPAFGITTLAAYAAPHLAENAGVAVAIDARHDHVYFQVFGPGGRTHGTPRIADTREAASIAAKDGARVVGTGAGLVAALWPVSAETRPTVDDREAPDIVWIGRLGVAADESTSPPKPLYLRAPDAQPQDAARLPRR
ncbi:MAG: tRNA (adenosine(37)-N6)-threonylcarbamoyltransferase complex dimerization subunit type 1 TsaB [Alphaproteobacteria bacterium]|nr:tRNA (adenosine(37)-N6)-threonylcarbamoyltransferase complex dimerization subunit type 1 TsaB [Alphaproteobacteria bacterium]